LKQAKILALMMVLVVAPLALAQGGGKRPEQSNGSTAAARALEVYEQGKRLYDAKDYAGALERFDQAAAIEPDKARWHYNRGLALRKLDRFAEARDALLHSRTLDPAYKRAEIDDKLREMGFSPTAPPSPPTSEPSTPSVDAPASEPSTSSVSTPPAAPPAPSVIPRGGTSKKPADPICALCPCIGMALLFFLLIRWQMPKVTPARDSPRASTLQPGNEELAPLEERLNQVAASLVQVEHALRLKEDADLRALLNQATTAAQNARQVMEDLRKGTAARSAVKRRIDKAHEAANAAAAHARGLFGEQAFLPEGERVGCYFCARPLANPAFRMQVPLKRGSQVTNVLACPPCANMAAAGQPPPVKVRRSSSGQTQHWSEVRGYDPYTHRHQPHPDMSTMPAWQYAPERSLGEVAALAAGGALATGLGAYGVSRLLDLDSASEAAAAQAVTQAVTQAAAKRASERREERDWKDHS
jgi:tetratricopeptide (TPR) repeat protein